jgi:uncharacterized membrane-anchored protein
MTTQTFYEAISDLLLNHIDLGDTITDGANNWSIDNLLDALKPDTTKHDLYTDNTGVYKVNNDGYITTPSIFRIIKNGA